MQAKVTGSEQVSRLVLGSWGQPQHEGSQGVFKGGRWQPKSYPGGPAWPLSGGWTERSNQCAVNELKF